MTREEFLNQKAEFIWMFNKDWFVKTKTGNFIWSDPDYPGGNNTFAPFPGDYKEACKHCGASYGRDKGMHIISEYCGNDIVILDNLNTYLV